MSTLRGLTVIPAYQEIESLPRVAEKLRSSPVDTEFLVVDDGSTDGTTEWLASSGLKHVRHPFNLGYAAGLETGILFALRHGYDYVAFLDADGQHRLSDLSRLLEAHVAGVDVVVGSRYLNGYDGQTVLRSLGSVFFSLVTRLKGQRIYDTTSGYKVLSRRAMAAALEGNFGDFHAEFLIHMVGEGMRIREVPIVVEAREQGESMYGAFSAFYYPVKTMLLITCSYLFKGERA